MKLFGTNGTVTYKAVNNEYINTAVWETGDNLTENDMIEILNTVYGNYDETYKIFNIYYWEKSENSLVIVETDYKEGTFLLLQNLSDY